MNMFQILSCVFYNVPFGRNYNNSVFGRLKFVLLRRLKCAIFKRLKYLSFGILQDFNFWEIEIGLFERLNMSFFGIIKCSFFDGFHMSFSGNWNVTFSRNEIYFSRKIKTVSFWENKFSFYLVETTHIRKIEILNLK